MFPYMGQTVAFNSWTQQFLVLEPMLKDLFDAAVNENNFDGLQSYYPGFYDTLKKSGFIVPKEQDELKKAINAREIIDLNDQVYEMVINPTMNCNFKCWYCYESHIKSSKMKPENINKVKAVIDNILNENPNLKFFHLSWFGGEPLLYFNDVVKPISEYLRKQIGRAHV